MVSLIGEAGVGKSRLIAELRALAAAAGSEERPAWLEGRCLEMDMLPGYAPFIDMFQAHFGFRAEETDESRCSRVGSALADMAARSDLSEERCEQIAPLLCRLLSLGPDHEKQELLQGNTAEELRHETFLAVRDFLVALARQRPVILAFEDLHWADGFARPDLLLMKPCERALLLLCAYRPDPKHRRPISATSLASAGIGTPSSA
jgi:predicted ATPase